MGLISRLGLVALILIRSSRGIITVSGETYFKSFMSASHHSIRNFGLRLWVLVDLVSSSQLTVLFILRWAGALVYLGFDPWRSWPWKYLAVQL